MVTENGVNTPSISTETGKAPEVKNEMQINWTEIKDKLKKKFSNLTDEDFAFEEGKQDEILVRVQNKIGKSKEEIQTLIATL